MLGLDKDDDTSRFPCRGQRTKSNAGTPDECVSWIIFTFSLNMRRIREARRKRIEEDYNERNAANANESPDYERRTVSRNYYIAKND